ncbi:hypothetical protein PFISCL1PPCAC_10373 [Pristionchus fissidentatus]|uniref:Bacterial transcriptional activator domain-containing protein n=1 Tax=Pristionchus fissidentatus TaxID=1538716 RepID=A0AAV5VI51_9BILA|nr:hypothetical protein PFISCL1PPCAC_10373 [Pristionchus fissidentatus]
MSDGLVYVSPSTSFSSEETKREIRLKCLSSLLTPLLYHLQNEDSTLSMRLRRQRSIDYDEPVIYRIRVKGGTPIEPMVMSWERRIHSLLLKYLDLEKALWTLSTLGGAYSALADYDKVHTARVRDISLYQLAIARELGDPVTEARCCLYLALSEAQKGEMDRAKSVVRRIIRIGEAVQSPVLMASSRGIYAKIRSIEKEIRERTYQPASRNR